MKRFYHLFAIATLIAAVSCTSSPTGPCGGGTQESDSREVEIDISTSGQSATRSTRAPLDGEVVDAGTNAEHEIATLDVLVFAQDGGYLYRREAYKVSTGVNTYRVMLKESANPLDILLFANSRDIIKAWEEAGSREGTLQAAVHTQLIDINPQRLVWQNSPVPLPMYGFKKAQIIDDEHSPSKWGNVQLLRSVASVDLYVEDKPAIRDTFKLEGIMAWYAPNRGYLAAMVDGIHTSPTQYLNPTDMATLLKGEADGMYADSVKTYVVPGTGGEEAKTYRGVANQIYFYDNPATSRSYAPNVRPTRIIVAGEFETSTGVWKESFYPIDIVYDDGRYRPAIRNWKYEFKVTSVSGPGYDTPEEAAEGAPIDLNVEIISWDKDDVQIGVKGHYYVSINSKNAILWRDQYSTQTLNLTYEVLDDDPVSFTYNFKEGSLWGTQRAIMGGIENDYFRVEMTHTPGTGGGAVAFKITALQAMAEEDATRFEYVTVKMRDLVFTLNITQFNGSEHDWEDGGDIGVDL